MKLSEYQCQGHSLTLVKGHSDFKVKCLTFGLYTQVSDSGPLGPLVLCVPSPFIRVAMVREKYLDNEIFPDQGKVRELCGWSGKFRKELQSQGKVREFENKWLWQADSRKFIYSV